MSNVSDNFNRADGPLGANWTSSSDLASAGGGSLVISSGMVTPSPSGSHFASFYNAAAFGNDQYAQATIKTGGVAGIVVRHQGSGRSSFYGFFVGNVSDSWYFRCDNGSFTQLAHYDTYPINFGSSVLKLRISGSTLIASIDGVDLPSVTDSIYASGYPGIDCGTAAIDDFTGGDLVTTIVGTLTATENPDTAAAAGVIATLGVLAAAEAADVLAAAGQIATFGALAALEAEDSFAANGNIIGLPIAGSMAAIEASDRLAGRGFIVFADGGQRRRVSLQGEKQQAGIKGQRQQAGIAGNWEADR